MCPVRCVTYVSGCSVPGNPRRVLSGNARPRPFRAAHASAGKLPSILIAPDYGLARGSSRLETVLEGIEPDRTLQRHIGP